MYKASRAVAFFFFALLAAPAAPRQTATVRGLSYDVNRLPPHLAHKGKVVAGAQWRDRNGRNVLLLTQTGAFKSRVRGAAPGERAAEVRAYQYVSVGSGRWKRLWALYDFQGRCEFDLYAGYLPRSLTVTDLDKDGIAETTFLYKLACRSDVSPARLKLILREGRSKYALRGRTRVKTSATDHAGGERSVDPAFRHAPVSFRSHALRQWDRFVKETAFNQL